MTKTHNQQSFLHYITNLTTSHNLDNISRTLAYQNFYFQYPEMKWALVASVVSRNAGWNMTDLSLPPFQGLLSDKELRRLFMTYERANWLIFSDAFPQLLIYSFSKEFNQPLFHLLYEFNVSTFMIDEWNYFWKSNDKERLLNALIINEQNLIQSPVIEQPFFKAQVFRSFPYLMQNFLLMNAVLLPNRKGKLHGFFVHGFTNIDNRIKIGQKIAALIEIPTIYNELIDFLISIEPTGSRQEYEQFLNINLTKSSMLRVLYPVITHQDIIREDWYKAGGIETKWLKKPNLSSKLEIGKSFYIKRKILFAYYHIKKIYKKDLYQ
ncbi:DUF2515 family protein [Oceanobacillus rekensis]|uniref:DUF2515 family protein n=1 Tax=Oceanobacillus rekensis TaxID=937927 RepID=UPI000B43BC07|nr:DUF2515 family protein [Oceanobacillus rekensis]